jgi:hypothetical protein
VDDDALTDAWERGEQLPNGISHEQHVRIAWVLLGRHERAVAVQRLLAGTERACAAHGVPEKFDCALTQRWITAIADALDRDGHGGSAGQFLAAHPELRSGKLDDEA